MAIKPSKEEITAFTQVMDAFEADEVMSIMLPKLNISTEQAERTADTLWLPEPYITQAYDGIDQTANFSKVKTQLSVPATIGYKKSSPFTLSATELRDAMQEQRLGDAARQALSAQINIDCVDRISMLGTINVKRTTAAVGFDDIGAIDVVLDEQGIAKSGRKFALSSRDWINVASDLAKRQDTQKDSATMTAYEAAAFGNIAGMDGYRLPYAKRLALAAGGAITVNTLDAGLNYYLPIALETSAAGEIRNHDNRFQTLTVSATASVKAGDWFTVANVYAVHHVTKQQSNSLKSFRVISVTDGTHLVISPPMISNQVAADASEQYQNCVVTSKNAAAVITWLNTADGYINPFWHDSAVKLIPGRYAIPSDAGLQVLRGTTKSVFELVMSKQGAINDLSFKYRFDVMYGIAVLQPEMVGGIMFSQP